jgi:DNA-binding transcriptional ArsR family regulator
MSRHVDNETAIVALKSLAQPTRLRAFQYLLVSAPDGRRAGEIARHCQAPHNTMSSHLAALLRTPLVVSKRQGQTRKFYADVDQFAALLAFLIEWCGDAPQIRNILAAPTMHGVR